MSKKESFFVKWIEMSEAKSPTIKAFKDLMQRVSETLCVDGQMKTCAIRVSPSLATHILENHNPNNRNKRPKVIKTMVRDIQSGDWNESHHQGIAFDSEGNLVDGQHRLSAIAESGVTLPLLCSFNIPSQNIMKVDRIVARTLADSLKMRGKSEGNDLLADMNPTTAGVLSTFARFLPDVPDSLSEKELLDILFKFKDAIVFAGHLPNNSRTKGLATSYHRTAIARAHSTGISPAGLDTFWRDFINGDGVCAASPVLRSYRDTMLLRGDKVTPKEKIFTFEKMLSMYFAPKDTLSGRKRLNIQTEPSFNILFSE